MCLPVDHTHHTQPPQASRSNRTPDLTERPFTITRQPGRSRVEITPTRACRAPAAPRRLLSIHRRRRLLPATDLDRRTGGRKPESIQLSLIKRTTMGLLTPSAFLSALPALFGATRSKGSLYLTVKRGALMMCPCGGEGCTVYIHRPDRPTNRLIDRMVG